MTFLWYSLPLITKASRGVRERGALKAADHREKPRMEVSCVFVFPMNQFDGVVSPLLWMHLGRHKAKLKGKEKLTFLPQCTNWPLGAKQLRFPFSSWAQKVVMMFIYHIIHTFMCVEAFCVYLFGSTDTPIYSEPSPFFPSHLKAPGSLLHVPVRVWFKKRE